RREHLPIPLPRLALPRPAHPRRAADASDAQPGGVRSSSLERGSTQGGAPTTGSGRRQEGGGPCAGPRLREGREAGLGADDAPDLAHRPADEGDAERLARRLPGTRRRADSAGHARTNIHVQRRGQEPEEPHLGPTPHLGDGRNAQDLQERQPERHGPTDHYDTRTSRRDCESPRRVRRVPSGEKVRPGLDLQSGEGFPEGEEKNHAVPPQPAVPRDDPERLQGHRPDGVEAGACTEQSFREGASDAPGDHGG
ncbi:unnamed protein product, partial [Prorocentrum cordatum]